MNYQVTFSYPFSGGGGGEGGLKVLVVMFCGTPWPPSRHAPVVTSKSNMPYASFKAILFKSEPAVRDFFFSFYFSVQTLLYTEETHGTEELLS